MAGVWTCKRNHRWRPNVTDSVTLDAVQPCPVCGAPGAIVDGDSTDHPAEFATLTSGDGVRAVPIEEVQVPGYAIDAEIGRGAMGVVYRATESVLNRPVALKMILAGTHAGSRDVARFRREVETVATLQHPNIVQIYAVGESGGLPFCALEYVDGGTLADRIGAGAMDPRESARLVAKLARAVQYAHAKGVIHRDLKPSNVLLDAHGRPKIADFGLAKLGESSNLTASTAVLGTPAYMAPEQADGQTRAITPAADVYSLGAILYEMLAGRPPFKAGSALETLHQVRHNDPPPIRRDGSIPKDLETICLKCLEKEPSNRYESAQALADDLDRFLAGESVLARPLSFGSRLARWAKRRQAALTGAVVATVVTLFVVALWNRAPSRHSISKPVSTNSNSDQASNHTTPPLTDESDLVVKVVTKSGERTGPGSPYLERGVVLTSSELVGMASKDSPPPEKIEVTYHPGRPDERTYAAEVASIDALLKIAILRVRTDQTMETPTVVASATPPQPAPPTRGVPMPAAPPADATPPKSPSAKSMPSGGGNESAKSMPAAVHLRATRPGATVSGNGFFAGSPGMIVTATRAIGLSSNTPLPESIEAIVEPGTDREQTLPARIASIDWANGVVILKAEGKDLPSPLTLTSGATMQENQQFIAVARAGEPKKDSAGKSWIFEPMKTRMVRVVGLSSFGPVKLIQIDTGSIAYGSPISNESGQVLGMVASGPLEGRNHFVVPAKSIEALLNGKMLSVLPGQPLLDGDRAMLPLTGRLGDPLARVSELSFAVWSGAPGRPRPAQANVPSPGDSPTSIVPARMLGPADSADGRIVELSIPIPALGINQVLWIRPRYRDANNHTHWGESIAIGMPPPVVRPVPAKLVFQPQVESRLTVQVRAPIRGEGRGMFQPEFNVALIESTNLSDGMLVNRLDCRDVTQRDRTANTFIHSTGNSFLYDMCHQTIELVRSSDGAIKKANIEAGHPKSAPNDIVENLTLQTVDTIKALTVPLPGREVQPNESWQASNPLTIGSARGNGEVAWQMTYKYLGRRPRNGREEAVIEIMGQPIGLAAADGTDSKKVFGAALGTAIVDLATGRVVQARIRLDGSVPGKDGVMRVFSHLNGWLARAEGANGPAPEFEPKLLPPDMPIQFGAMPR